MTATRMTRRRVLAVAVVGAAGAAAGPVLAGIPAAEAATIGSSMCISPGIRSCTCCAARHTARRRRWQPRGGPLGATAWLNQQLAPQLIDDSVCDSYVARYPNLTKSIAQVRAAFPDGSWDVMLDLGRATMVRAA